MGTIGAAGFAVAVKSNNVNGRGFVGMTDGFNAYNFMRCQPRSEEGDFICQLVAACPLSSIFFGSAGVGTITFDMTWLDEPPPAPSGQWVGWQETATLAASGSFSLTDVDWGLATAWQILLKHSRSATVRINWGLDGQILYFVETPIVQVGASGAGAAGSVFHFAANIDVQNDDVVDPNDIDFLLRLFARQ